MVKLSPDRDIYTALPYRVRVTPKLDGESVSVGTATAYLLNVSEQSVSQALRSPQAPPIATVSGSLMDGEWLFEFQESETSLLLANPSDPYSAIKAESVTLALAFDDFPTIYQSLKVGRGLP